MSTLEFDPPGIDITSVEFSADDLVVSLADGRKIVTPLIWYPRLVQAKAPERANFVIMPGGIHWPDLDEDLSLAGMFSGRPSRTNWKALQSKGNEREKEFTKQLPVALTNLLRPFSEEQGLRTSQIRLQREDVLIEVTNRARTRIESEKLQTSPVPNKFLVPFLEKASLEDMTSRLLDAWANLLVEASKNFDPKLTAYIDILSKIGGRDAEFLSRVYDESDSNIGISWPLGHFAVNELIVENNLAILDQRAEPVKRKGNHEEAKRHWTEFKKKTKLLYGYLVHATVLQASGYTYFYNTDITFVEPLMVDRLEAERLLKRSIRRFPERSESLETGTVSYVELTYLAIDLVRICTLGLPSSD
jgi:hypothetical protein